MKKVFVLLMVALLLTGTPVAANEVAHPKLAAIKRRILKAESKVEKVVTSKPVKVVAKAVYYGLDMASCFLYLIIKNGHAAHVP